MGASDAVMGVVGSAKGVWGDCGDGEGWEGSRGW